MYNIEPIDIPKSHYEICKSLAEAYYDFARSKSPMDRFVLEMAYACYEASCKEVGVTPCSLDEILDISGRSGWAVIILPFI